MKSCKITPTLNYLSLFIITEPTCFRINYPGGFVALKLCSDKLQDALQHFKIKVKSLTTAFADSKNLMQIWQTKVEDQTPTPQKVTFGVPQILNFMSFLSKCKSLQQRPDLQKCNILHQMNQTCPMLNVRSDGLQCSSSLPTFQTSTRHNSIRFCRFKSAVLCIRFFTPFFFKKRKKTMLPLRKLIYLLV